MTKTVWLKVEWHRPDVGSKGQTHYYSAPYHIDILKSQLDKIFEYKGKQTIKIEVE